MHWAIWIVAGIVVALAELIIPGLIALFVGGGAVVTGILIAAGWLQDLTSQILCWLVVSLALFFLFREQIRKRFPSLERREAMTEDQVMLGKIVEVIEEIAPGKPGRVHLHQSSWKAVSDHAISVGKKVRIIRRDHMHLTVEPVE